MAKKKKHYVPPPAPETAPAADKPVSRYEDSFQYSVGRRVEEAGKRFEGQGRNLLYGLGAIAVIGVLIWIFVSWNNRSTAAAQTALGKAIEVSSRRVTDEALPADSTEKVFKSEKERAEAAIKEFQTVVDTYGGSVGDKAKYFIAVNQLAVDRAAGISALESLANGSGSVASVAKFALAGTKESDGQLDQALELYRSLAASSDPVYSKDTINLAMANIYEKQGKKQEAVDLLFTMLKAASEAKDADGKAIPFSGSLLDAQEKLNDLDPAKAKELPQQESPFGGPIGM